MMKLRIEIDLDNAAFEDNPEEIGLILRKVADEMHCRDIDRPNLESNDIIRDTNGNLVGGWFVSGDLISEFLESVTN